MLTFLGFFEENMPTEKAKLLNYCLSITYSNIDARPFKQIFSSIIALELHEVDRDSRHSALRNVEAIITNKLRGRLRDDRYACAIIESASPHTERGDTEIQKWDDPVEKQRENPEFFSKSENVDRYIDLATERYGFHELLQIEQMLNIRRQASSNETHYDIDLYLENLKRPIQRIGCRDHMEDKNEFAYYWRRTTSDFELTVDPLCLNHILDMLCGLTRFMAWDDKTEVTMITRQLNEIFLGVASSLGVPYGMKEEDF